MTASAVLRLPRAVWLPGLILLVLLALGGMVRLRELKEPPLAFHPARQFFCASRAHALYVFAKPFATRRELAVARSNGRFIVEPPVIERLAAFAYAIHGVEDLAIPRRISILCWLLGGLFLYLLAARLFTPLPALCTTGFYLFLPYGIRAGAAFQPDPLMIALLLASLYAIWCYAERPILRNLLFAGLCVAAALYVKVSIAFFIAGGFFGIFLARPRDGARPPLTDLRLWLVVTLALAPTLYYYYDGLYGASFLRGQAAHTFVPHLLGTASYWSAWLQLATQVVGAQALTLALVGVVLTPRPMARGLLLGLWTGYLLYGILFTYAIISHDYYQLPLIPLVALSLGRLCEIGWEHARGSRATMIAAGALCLGVLLVVLRPLPVPQLSAEVRQMPVTARKIGALVGHSTHTLVSSFAYGEPLFYYGALSGTALPTAADGWAAALHGRPTPAGDAPPPIIPADADYCVITDGAELAPDAPLRQWLAPRYPCLAATESYCVYDLAHPKKEGR